MADSLLFDGVDDYVQCSIGGAAFAFGPGTAIAIVKLSSDAGAYKTPLHAGASGGVRYGIFHDPGQAPVLALDGSLPTVVETITAAQGWQLYGWTKATGTVAARLHRYNYGTTTWTHVDDDLSFANSSTPATKVNLGADASEGANWPGNILIAGVWNSVLSDGAIELLKDGYQEWVDAAPLEAWRLDSMSAIQSFGTTGTADESSRVGTTLDTGDVPAGWDDTLGGSAASSLRTVQSNLRWT